MYVAVTGGGGWGVAVSTDTALALGVLTLAGGDRVFLLTLLVVDDLVALLVISFVYSEHVDAFALLLAVALFAALLTMRAIGARQFRATGAGRAPSPNDRIQHRLHPWTTLVVVPVFALANAGVRLDGELLLAAATSAITWGIVLAYAVGKPLGIAAAVRAASRRAPSCLRATAFSAGVGFTVSLLIASRAFDGAQLDQARIGILVTALLAPLLAVASTAMVRPRVSTCPAA